jgi:uncharacterized protein involved in propanediol utilization
MAEEFFNEDRKELLKQAQFARAMAGSDIMLTHLGKTVLGQTEKHHHVIEVPLAQYSREQIIELIAQRSEELGAAALLEDFTAQALIGPAE